MSETHSCKYCDKDFYWHRLLNHYMKAHKTEFLTDKDHKCTLQTFYKRKGGISKAVIEKNGSPVYCCFGCMKLFSREHYMINHQSSSKSCKEKHIAFEEENKMMFLDDKIATQIVSDNDTQTLLEKNKALQAEIDKLKKANSLLTERLKVQTESADEEMEKRMALQEIVDEELTSQQREIFKRILARKNPDLFKDLYDEHQYEVSVDDSDEEDSVSEGKSESDEDGEVPFIPPRNIIVSAKPSEPQYKIFHYKDEVLFRDNQDVLYDKTPRGYIRCGIIKNGEIEWN